jgi:hypothetical protein
MQPTQKAIEVMENLSSIQTRNESFKKVQENPMKLNVQQKIIFQAVQLHGRMTDGDLEKLLGWGVNIITARRNELVNEKVLLKQDGSTVDGGKPVALWNVFSTPEDRMEAIFRAHRELKQQIESLESDFNEGFTDDTKEVIQDKIYKLKRKLSKIDAL